MQSLQGGGDQGDALADRGGVPQATVLLGHGNGLPVGRGPRRAAGVGEQHQGEQPGGLGVGRQQAVQQPGQPDRLGAQVRSQQPGSGCRRVAFGEDQVERVPDCRQVPGALLGRGRGEPGAAVGDGPLGSSDPPRHGPLGDQERTGDLRGGQAADRAQCKGDL